MIYISAEDWNRGAFRMWMRTGRWPRTPAAGHFDVKYNHWHDQSDGRFTFAGSGQHDGNSEASTRGRIMGGGGTSGGGGPNWENTPGPRLRALMRAAEAEAALAKPPSAPHPSAPPPLTLIRRNGYEFRIDATARTREVTGPLTTGSQPRSRSVQARAGVPDRLATDDGGHYIAPRFNGPAEAFNHFAQDSNFNRGRYRAIEDEWAKAKRAGMKVTVKIVPRYESSSRRPSVIDIYWNAGGFEKSAKIPNRRQEAPRVRH